MKWKTLIVDDEEPAREELAYLLGCMEDVSLIAQAKTGMEAIKAVKEYKPDLLFLDIGLPDINGLQVAELIYELGIEVKIVFVTAYDQYAIEAFKLRAFHYILKPYDEEDIKLVFREISLLKKQHSTKSQNNTAIKLSIETEGTVKYLFPKDIVYISKDSKHVTVHMKDKAYIAQYTLQELELKLEPHAFFRCHKSYLVNLQYAHELQTWLNGAYNLFMDDSQKSMVPVSRNYVRDLRLKLEI